MIWVCPFCGQLNKVGDRNCQSCNLDLKVLGDAIAAERERCAGICDVLGDEYAIARECARRIRGEK